MMGSVVISACGFELIWLHAGDTILHFQKNIIYSNITDFITL